MTAAALAPTPEPEVAPRRRDDERLNPRSSIPFFLLHLTPLLVIWTGITRTAVILFLVTYFARMFFITATYHRYFAHKTFRLGRVAQFVMAFGATTAAQKGPLWWAAHHRTHHKFTDTDLDVHSPKKGFFWSHVGWILCDRYGPTDFDSIKDFARYPELRFLNRFDWIGPWALGVACFLIGGWSGLVVGFFCSTVVLWHVTFSVNSIAHIFGRRTYDTDDTSRNSLLVALATGGEGWHNNHHRYASSAKQGFRWWQIDTTYYVLRALSWVGIVKDLRPVPQRILDEGRAAR
ncbi:MAG TPA: acyl-CoA desaturase [Acidimicrobiia bacterium]|nr:acyl-CoA desaturase [Acidimicrobiia bacterium]